MLPEFLLGLPNGVTTVLASNLSVGDILFLETASSGAPVRSLVTAIRGNHYTIMNRLHPDPYDIWMKDSKKVLALKLRPPRTKTKSVSEASETLREEFNRSKWTIPPEYDDPRSYWNWDPKDPRAKEEFYAVEENDWKRLKFWEQRQNAKAKTPPKDPPNRKSSRTKNKPKSTKVDDTVREWYKSLNVKVGVTKKQLKAALKKRLFETHPDRCKDVDAEENFKKASAAYQGLLELLFKKAP